ncbi:MAG: exosortase O [Cyanobacteria bacterium CRU_2_1]|nr:exosortase O [Cyanobacteria bacterium CRU_2_1]
MTSEGSLARSNARFVGTLWLQVGSSAIVLSWLYLNLPTLQWLGQVRQEISPFNGLLIGVGVILLLIQGVRSRRFFNRSGVIELRLAPLGLMVGCGIAAIVIRWLIDFEQLPAMLFLLGSYGLLGLFLAEPVWRKGLPVAGAIACVIPFWVQFQSGLGFPARILTAHVVRDILATWKIAALSSEDVIVLDTGIAQIDLPCSGLKSLWTGTLLLLGATWIEGRRMGIRWLLVCLTHLALLIIANIARVLTLVVITLVLNRSDLAEILHMPIGLISFITVCLLTWVLLWWVPRHKPDEKTRRSDDQEHGSNNRQFLDTSTILARGRLYRTPTITQSIVVVCILGLTLIPLPPAKPTPQTLTTLQWTSPMQTQSVPLTAIERNFFASYPGVAIEEQRFQFQGVSGSLLLVSSPTWRAHHPPEICHISSGFELNHMEQRQLASDVTGRWLSLEDGTRTAAYWYQSPKRTTDEYLSRVWGEVTRQEQTWTMVSILFDRPENLDDPQVQGLLNAVHETLDRHLQGVEA